MDFFDSILCKLGLSDRCEFGGKTNNDSTLFHTTAWDPEQWDQVFNRTPAPSASAPSASTPSVSAMSAPDGMAEKPAHNGPTAPAPEMLFMNSDEARRASKLFKLGIMERNLASTSPERAEELDAAMPALKDRIDLSTQARQINKENDVAAAREMNIARYKPGMAPAYARQ